VSLRAAVLAVAALLAGCQSASFNVSVDLYNENPRAILPMAPETATRLVEQVERLRASAKHKTALRIELASAGWQIYSQTWLDSGLLPDAIPDSKNAISQPTAFRSHEKQHMAYVNSAEEAEKALQPYLDDAVRELVTYLNEYEAKYEEALAGFQICERFRLKSRREQRAELRKARENGKDTTLWPCWPYEKSKNTIERLDDEWVLRRLPIELRRKEAEVRSVVAQAVERYRGFAGPLAQSFVIDWAGLRAKLYAGLESAQYARRSDEEFDLKRALFALDGRIATLAGTTGLIPRTRIEDAIDKDAHDAATGLFNSMLKIAVELESLRTDLPDDASAQTALAGLVRQSSRFTELIDRLQDTGDPVWRLVTDPANEGHWNPQSVDTNFYAQGNSSLVVVRHDPMRYDIHEATNNPLALVKGQLAISHAVTKAAINIAGAATGLPTPTPGQDDSGNPVPPSDTQRTDASAAAEGFANDRARAEEAERMRERALRGLSQELSSIHATVTASGSDVNLLMAQRSRLESVLRAYRVLFEAASN